MKWSVGITSSLKFYNKYKVNPYDIHIHFGIKKGKKCNFLFIMQLIYGYKGQKELDFVMIKCILGSSCLYQLSNIIINHSYPLSSSQVCIITMLLARWSLSIAKQGIMQQSTDGTFFSPNSAINSLFSLLNILEHVWDVDVEFRRKEISQICLYMLSLNAF